MAVFYVHVWAKCDFWTNLLTKALVGNLDMMAFYDGPFGLNM